MPSSDTPPHPAKPAGRVHAATHLFANGQAVKLKNAFMSSGNIYRVTAILPPSGASPQYHIRNEAENFERMALESDLEPVDAAPRSQGQAATQSLFGDRGQA